MIEEKIAEIELQIKDISRIYWKYKNLCACYTEWFGEWNDEQMVNLAIKAQELGRRIRYLKDYRKDLVQELEDSLI